MLSTNERDVPVFVALLLQSVAAGILLATGIAERHQCDCVVPVLLRLLHMLLCVADLRLLHVLEESAGAVRLPALLGAARNRCRSARRATMLQCIRWSDTRRIRSGQPL